ncbi:DNA-binding protein [Pandoraea anapnoica]|uniref:DNA-binding protein n=1 Tax=Pandoraea anapnoica TaxID=2508301 RepID=A0A5E5ATU2_9BURK|nr:MULTISPECIES: DUF1804 family protein [Pandoraea]VVE14984.1 DNA-binding protein [Pandoraea iniqua]VVE76638.1 DNA-binding protein [Pandoraea anapnoica]
MAYPKSVRDKVRRRYVFDRMPLEQAAAAANVSYATACRWKQDAQDGGDDWDKALAAQLFSGGAIEDITRQMLVGLITQYQATMVLVEESPDIPPAKKVQLLASLADAYNKTIGASKRVLTETNELAVAMGVMRLLADFVKQQYPQYLQAFSDVLMPFGDALTKTYGSNGKTK